MIPFFGIGSATGAPIHCECILSLISFLMFWDRSLWQGEKEFHGFFLLFSVYFNFFQQTYNLLMVWHHLWYNITLLLLCVVKSMAERRPW